jgi:hypothetical protein
MSSIGRAIDSSAERKTLNVSCQEVVSDPFPHITKETFIESNLYARLKAEFPPDDVFARNTSLGGRAGRDLYRGDAAYDELLRTSPAWREFYKYINSPSYIDLARELFGQYFERFGCSVDNDRAQFVDCIEQREVLVDKTSLGRVVREAKNLLAGTKHKDELFVRLDIAQGAIGYGKPVHCDRPNRLTSMLVYFCDAEEIGLKGGDLLLHEHLEKRSYKDYERHPHAGETRVIASYPPKENRGVFFLCSNNSYHSATSVTAQKGFRNFIYVSISSRAPSIWS